MSVPNISSVAIHGGWLRSDRAVLRTLANDALAVGTGGAPFVIGASVKTVAAGGHDHKQVRHPVPRVLAEGAELLLALAVDEEGRDVVEANEEDAARCQVLADGALNLALLRFGSRHSARGNGVRFVTYRR